MRMTLPVVLVALCLGSTSGFAQDVQNLVASGRFEEAAASLAGADTEVVAAGATLILTPLGRPLPSGLR
jgi:hypothetical protein